MFLKHVLSKYNKIRECHFVNEFVEDYKKLLFKITLEINQDRRPEFLNEFSRLSLTHIADTVHSSTVYKSCQSYYTGSTVSFSSSSLSRQPCMQSLNFGTM